MILGLIGDTQRTEQWEHYLRPFPDVEKVILAPRLQDVKEADALILLTAEPDNRQLEEVVRLGLHCFAIQPPPESLDLAKRLEQIAAEARVQLHFSHWPTHAPTTLAMHREIPSPERVVVVRTDTLRETLEQGTRARQFWVDEIGWILKITPSPVHKIEAETLFSASLAHPGLQLRIQFHNGSTALFVHQPLGSKATHLRWLFRGGRMFECDVLTQRLSRVEQPEGDSPLLEEQTLNAETTAHLALEQFLRSLSNKKAHCFTIHDLVAVLETITRVRRLL